MLRPIKDSDLVLHARLRMTGPDDAFSDCVIVRADDKTITVARPYHTQSTGLAEERTTMTRAKAKLNYWVYSSGNGMPQL